MATKHVLMRLKDVKRLDILVGKRSKIEIRIMIVPEKPKIKLIEPFLSILGINTSKEPISVPKPAIVLIMSGVNIFILDSIKKNIFYALKNYNKVIIVLFH